MGTVEGEKRLALSFSTGEKGRTKDEVFYHDVFNILFLSLISWYNIKFLSKVDLSAYGTEELAYGVEERELFSLVHMMMTTYFCIDLLYIWAVPQAVLSKQSTLIIHHLLSLLFLFFPAFHPQFSFHCSCVISLEINSLFLTLRRNVSKDTFIYKVFDNMFLFTWITLRLIMLPVLLIMFVIFDYYRIVSFSNVIVNFGTLAILLQSCLIYMSFTWTFDLLRKHHFRTIL